MDPRNEITTECKCCGAIYYSIEEKCPVCGYDEDLYSVKDYAYNQYQEYNTDDLEAIFESHLTDEEIYLLNLTA